MKIESIRLKNFKSFKDTELSELPNLCVIVGANGTGKSTFFQVFGFLRDAMHSNVTAALARLGGSRGFNEVRSRNSKGPIEIELKFRTGKERPLITYFLQINEKQGKAFVEREVLKYRRGSSGQPWHFLDFSNGKGTAVTNELKPRSAGQKMMRNSRLTWLKATKWAIYGTRAFSLRSVASPSSFVPTVNGGLRSKPCGQQRTGSIVGAAYSAIPLAVVGIEN